jgi:hypothetical protein
MFIRLTWENPSGRDKDETRTLILPVAGITAAYVDRDYETVIECHGKRYQVGEGFEQIERLLKPEDPAA